MTSPHSDSAKHWAETQLTLDRERTCAFPGVLGRKRERMLASPLAFLRGAAPLFYELLHAYPELAAGPAETGWIVGDAHLENFGAFTPRKSPEVPNRPKVTFDLNDFDEAHLAPLQWDVLRLTTSLLLAGRELRADGPRVLQLGRSLVHSYVEATAGAPLPPTPQPVLQLLGQAAERSKKSLLDARTSETPTKKDARHFRRGPRYLDVPADTGAAVTAALSAYVDTLDEDERPKPSQLELVDCAFRVAGTGSLGALRLAALTQGKGGSDGGFVFDLKEHLSSSVARALPSRKPTQATDAVSAYRASVEWSPRWLGTAIFESPSLGKRNMVVRRLTPQEDKLELAKLESRELPALAVYLGALLGRAHARGLGQTGRVGWNTGDCQNLLERATALAGLHSAIYLAYCLRSEAAPFAQE